MFTNVRVQILKRFQGFDSVPGDIKKKKSKVAVIASGKLSDYHLRRIIKAYAYEIPAADAAKSMNVSYVTVRNTYALIRRRMMELNVYQTRERYEDFMEEEERDDGPYWDPSDYEQYVKRGLGLRRGVTPATREEHIAELIFRFAKPPHLTTDQHNARHHADIVQLIKLTGPLNRPLTDAARDRAFLYRGERLLSVGHEAISRILNAAVRDRAGRPDYGPAWPVRRKYRR